MRVRVSELDCAKAYTVRIHDYALYDELSDSVRLYDGEMRIVCDQETGEWDVAAIRQMSTLDIDDEPTTFPYGEWVEVDPSWAMNGVAPEDMVEIVTGAGTSAVQ
jgi:hypothetical protein